jgi:hypothetical protein
MRNLFVLGLLAFSVGCFGQQNNSYTSGNDFLKYCQASVKSLDNPYVQMSEIETFDDGMCRGMVTGIFEISSRSCPSEGSTVGQAIRVVFKFLQDHPEKLHLRASELTERALAQAFPCPK